MNRLMKISRLAQILYHYKSNQHLLPNGPIRLWIESTNECNLRCRVCPNATDQTSRRGTMDLAIYRSIMEQIQGITNDVNLSHRGEPLFHPQLEDMIQIARDYGIGTRIHTNATTLDESRSRSLLEAGPDLISFSFDGYDKETYESVRIGADFNQTLRNIKIFLSEKKKTQLHRPYTIIQIIEPWNATPEYRERLNAFGRELRQFGLDKFYVKRPHNWAGNAPGDIDGARFIPCTFIHYSLTVLWDGTVCPCPQDWYGTMPIGNVHHQSISDIWNGPELTELRRRMNRRDLDGLLCHNCDRIFRSAWLGIPTENIKAFLGETLAGYRWVARLIQK